MEKRILTKSWIDSYLYFTEKQESPEEFHRWCAFSLLAATLERSCWLDFGYFKVFPNLYIVLVGASATVRKSEAINMAARIFDEAFPKGYLFSQKITAVAFILFLRDSFKERKISGGYIVADELSVFLGNAIQDATLVQMLTKIYGCPDTMDYSTVQRGREKAFHTFCNLLGGTTPEWIKDSFPAHAIGGGFAGRISFIYAEKTDRRFAFPELDANRVEVRRKLVVDLRTVSSLEGKFILTEKAKAWYTNWYEDLFKPDLAESDLKGYYGRKHTLVLKLAMVLCVAEGNDMEINRDHIADAIDFLRESEKMLPETLMLIQSTIVGQNQQKILTHIRRSPEGKMSRTYLLRKMSYQMNAKDLDELVSTLQQSDRLKTTVDAETNATYFEIK